MEGIQGWSSSGAAQPLWACCSSAATAKLQGAGCRLPARWHTTMQPAGGKTAQTQLSGIATAAAHHGRAAVEPLCILHEAKLGGRHRGLHRRQRHALQGEGRQKAFRALVGCQPMLAWHSGGAVARLWTLVSDVPHSTHSVHSAKKQAYLRRLDGRVGADRQRRAGGRCPAGRRGAAAGRGGRPEVSVSAMWGGWRAFRRQGLVGGGVLGGTVHRAPTWPGCTAAGCCGCWKGMLRPWWALLLLLGAGPEVLEGGWSAGGE